MTDSTLKTFTVHLLIFIYLKAKQQELQALTTQHTTVLNRVYSAVSKSTCWALSLTHQRQPPHCGPTRGLHTSWAPSAQPQLWSVKFPPLISPEFSCLLCAPSVSDQLAALGTQTQVCRGCSITTVNKTLIPTPQKNMQTKTCSGTNFWPKMLFPVKIYPMDKLASPVNCWL